MTLRETLTLVIIPIAIALLPLIWGLTAWILKRVQIQALIFRELEEIKPYPEIKYPYPKEGWLSHHSNKKMLHKEILDRSTENVDLIISLSPDVVYYTTQLWNAWDDSRQWLYMLSMLETKVPFWQKGRREKIAEVKKAWYVLMREYGEEFNDDFVEEHGLERCKLSRQQQQRLEKVNSPGSKKVS